MVWNAIKKTAAWIAAPAFFIYIMISKPDHDFLNALHKPVASIFIPVGQALTWPIRSSGRFLTTIAEYHDIHKENEMLRKQLDERLRDNSDCEVLRETNAKQARLLGIPERERMKSAYGEIVSSNSFGGNSFITNIGFKDNIHEGDMVLSSRGNVIGFVSSATDNYSKIKSLTDINSQILAKVSGTEIFAFLQGNNTEYPYLEYYSNPDFVPEIGMKISTSSVNSLMPEDIPIGEIKKIVNKSRALIELYDNPQKIINVQILKYNFRDKYKAL
jgi:rod shape-determining protein MreC